MEAENKTENQLPISNSTQTEQIPSSSEIPKFKSKLKLPVIIAGVVLILLLIIGVSAVLFKQPKSEPTKQAPQSTPAISPASEADWKVYTNNVYKYQLKMPKDWIVDESNPGGRFISPDKQLLLSSGTDDYRPKVETCEAYVKMPDVQLGQYTATRYMERCSTSDDKTVYTGYIQPMPADQEIIGIFNVNIYGDFDKNNTLVLQILKTFKITAPPPSTDSLVTYSIPPGWKVSTKQDTYTGGIIRIDSPNFVEGVMSLGTEGMQIVIQINKEEGKTLQSYKESFMHTAGLSDFKDIAIDGVPGLTYHTDYEGHTLNYFFIKSSHEYRISFYSASLSEENKYRNEVNNFINSVRFK